MIVLLQVEGLRDNIRRLESAKVKVPASRGVAVLLCDASTSLTLMKFCIVAVRI
jgi:hypothetical protein